MLGNQSFTHLTQEEKSRTKEWKLRHRMYCVGGHPQTGNVTVNRRACAKGPGHAHAGAHVCTQRALSSAEQHGACGVRDPRGPRGPENLRRRCRQKPDQEGQRDHTHLLTCSFKACRTPAFLFDPFVQLLISNKRYAISPSPERGFLLLLWWENI